MFLHAFQLEMKHPKKELVLSLEAPMPEEFRAFATRFGSNFEDV